MNGPMLTAMTYLHMQYQRITDEEVFAAFHSPFVRDTTTPQIKIGVAPLSDKTVFAVYTEAPDGQATILNCWARYFHTVEPLP